MPNRILKQTICTSPNLNTLSMGAENFFYRLIVQCDDFGRYYANLSILRAHCFPLRLDHITDALVGEWLTELVNADLLFVYDQGRHLQMTNWRKHQSPRATTSRFPNPTPDEIDSAQMHATARNRTQPLASAPVFVFVNENESVNGNESYAPAAPEPPAAAELPKPPEKPKTEPKPTPTPELMVTTIAHGAELQQELDKHFAGLANPHPAWSRFASQTQRDKYAAAAAALNGEFVQLAVTGLARGAQSRDKLLGWLEGCVKNHHPPGSGPPRDKRHMSVADKLQEQDGWDWDKITGAN